MPEIVCDHCGGTDFYKEVGFYYCSGCQLQSQEIQEYAHDIEYTRTTNAQGGKKGRKIHSDKTPKADNKITSWECYNYILLGLTEELINLGADKEIKPIVRILWLRYLEKLEVFKRGENALPKLQGVNSMLDAEIVYGHHTPKRKRKRKSSSSEMDAASIPSTSLRFERSKRKRALIRAQYDEYSQKSQGTPSLHTETLTSLQTPSEKSTGVNTIPLVYNKYTSKQLKRIKPSYYHWKQHRHDFDRKMNCHKISGKEMSFDFRISPNILSINKLYAILYLALLIVKDKIQLCDLLRFMKEGNLSYNYYNHLLPEEYLDKILNFKNFKKPIYLINYSFRTICAKMAIFLQINKYIQRPDLCELCERYCQELNLPNEICLYVKKILSISQIKMHFGKRIGRIPNYEGRVLSIIIFVIKLLFGLDDVTEVELSNYTEIINSCDYVQPKFFDIVEWLKFIEYRQCVLAEHYIPYDDGDVKNINLLAFMQTKKKYETNFKTNSRNDNLKQILNKIKDVLPEPEGIEFPVTLTPYSDYTKLLPKENYLNILTKNFYLNSLLHILKPDRFLSLANKGEKPEIVNGGANENWTLEKVTCCTWEAILQRTQQRSFVTVKLNQDENYSFDTTSSIQENTRSSEIFKEDFKVLNATSFRKNLNRIGEQNADVDFDFDRIQVDGLNTSKIYPKHFNPYERFWLRTRIRFNFLGKEDFRIFFNQFSFSFKLLVKECSRIAQQAEQEFLEEYQLTELFLTYCVVFKKSNRTRKTRENLIKSFLQKSVNLW